MVSVLDCGLLYATETRIISSLLGHMVHMQTTNRCNAMLNL